MPTDISSLQIRIFPDPILRTRSAPVDQVTDEVRAVAERMIELMHGAPGVGLAANQVGLVWRLFVADVEPDPEGDDFRSADTDPPSAMDGPRVYINPVLGDYSRELAPFTEGCLSLPGIEGEIRRPAEVTITALDLEAQPFTQRAGGLLARVWQHECDHLDGTLILDRMIPIDRRRNRIRVREMEDTPGEPQR